MPYIIKKVKESGKTAYKVCKRDNPSRCFSEHGMTEEKAKKQRTAIILSEMGLSRPRGGAGSSDSSSGSDAPKTINGIKEWLNMHGFEAEVVNLLPTKPKLADWKKLYKSSVTKLKTTPMVEPTGTIVKNAEEAFQRMSMK